MKNLILLFSLFLTVILTSCFDKKDDPKPVQPIVNNTNTSGIDTTLLKNKWWVNIKTSGGNVTTDSVYFNTNHTYTLIENIETPGYPTSSSTANGTYYISNSGGGFTLYYDVPNVNGFYITSLTATRFDDGTVYTSN